MKIKVTHNSVELKLTMEEVDKIQALASINENQASIDPGLRFHASILNEKLINAKEAANKLNWMDGI